ncbi:MAG: ATP-binding protein [Bacteriovoracaceae bacterium]
MKGIVFFLLYVVTAVAGLKLSAVNNYATLLWVPTGLSLAILYLWGLRLWPVVAVGALVTNYWIGKNFGVALGMSVGNTLEAIIGVSLFLRFCGPGSRLEKVREVTSFLFSGALVGPVVSATVGVTSLALAGSLNESFLRTWAVWFAGNSISAMVIGSFLIVWKNPPRIFAPFKRMFEGGILLGCIVALCLAIFGPLYSPELYHYVRTYWIFIFLIWTTLRFGQPANTFVVLTLFTIAVTCTLMGYGHYQHKNLADNLFHLQTFLGAVAISGLYFAALGAEKDEALRIRTDFISIASHELRTPLTSFEVSLHYLKELLSDKSHLELAPEAIAVLERQSKKMGAMVDSLLNVAKIESGNLVMEKKETDISSLVRDVAADLSGLVAYTRCSLQLEIQPMVKGNCSAYGIEQVLTNLIMNAIKYGAGSPVKIKLESCGKRACITVQDEGRGIAPEDHQKIFERYMRVNKGNGTQGLGLGLYISKLIVDAHQGKIIVESALGKGATFKVDLPVT